MKNFEITLKADAVTAELTALKRRLEHPEVLMAGVAQELHTLTDEAFIKESVFGGPKWPGLAASTIEQRKKGTKHEKTSWPGKILDRGRRGNTLINSVQVSSSATEAKITVSSPYGAIHQFGGQAGRGKKVTIPARPYLPMRKSGSDLELTEPARKSILAMLGDFVNGPG